MPTTVNRQLYGERFAEELETAAVNAEDILKRAVSRAFVILLYGAGVPGEEMSVDEALEKLFVGDDMAWVFIKIAVLEAEEDRTRVFVRASGHQPVTWDELAANGRQRPFVQAIYQGLYEETQ